MSAGALHPVELYVSTSSGLSHYHPGERALRRLRDEDPRAALAAAAAAPELAARAVVLVLTGILWRTAWKYGSRGWRHIFWDAGAMLANLLALADDARVLTAFLDGDVAAALGVEPPREAPVALLGVRSAERAPCSERLDPLCAGSSPLSQREHRFPEAEAAQAASALSRSDEVRAWREAAQRFGSRPAGVAPPAPLEDVILRRGSARDFTPEAVDRRELEEALAWAGSPVPGDLPPICSSVIIAHAVRSLEPGVYRFEPPNSYVLVRRGADRRKTAHLCLDQRLGGRAAAAVFFMADLDRTIGTLGERGYRAAQLDAGIRAGRASLGAYARGLGATGLTFYDDEVRRFMGSKEQPMMCLAVGIDARRPSLRPAARAR
jgi:SagB-type dehydrogenase family enzyme